MLPTFAPLALTVVDAPPPDELVAGSLGRVRLVAERQLCTPFEFLYGGTGIAACIEAAELVTQRPLQWSTVQFVGAPVPGDVVELDVHVRAHGRATSQTEVVGRVDGEIVFSAVGAHTSRPGGDGASFLSMPEVPAPDECERMGEPFARMVAGSFFDLLDRRVAVGAFGPNAVGHPQTGTLAMWARLTDAAGEAATAGIGSAASQAFVADIVPLGVCAALGIAPGGTSLDNTMRIIDTRPSEWVLTEIVPEGFHRSIGHGSVRMWSEDGRLLGVAQQTCIIRTSHHR